MQFDVTANNQKPDETLTFLDKQSGESPSINPKIMMLQSFLIDVQGLKQPTSTQ